MDDSEKGILLDDVSFNGEGKNNTTDTDECKETTTSIVDNEEAATCTVEDDVNTMDTVEDDETTTDTVEDEDHTGQRVNKKVEYLFSEPLFNKVSSDSEQKVLAVVNLFIRSGESVEIQRDLEDQSLLHVATKRNFIHVVTLLLKHKVDPLVFDKSNKTAIHVAIDRKNDRIASMMIKALPKYKTKRFFSMEGHIEYKGAKLTLFELVHNKFKKCVVAVLDALYEEEEDGSYTIYAQLLEEDKYGRVPKSQDSNLASTSVSPAEFDFDSVTVFQSIVELQDKDIVCHPVMRVVSDHKWTAWGRRNTIVSCIVCIFSVFCLTFSIVTSVAADDATVYNSGLHYARAVFEAISYLSAVAVTGFYIRYFIMNRFGDRRRKMYWLEIISAFPILLALPVRYAHSQVHWYIMALGYLLWVLRLYKYAPIFSGIGTYAEALRKILMEDFVQFFTAFGVILLAFGGSFLLVLKGDGTLQDNVETGSLWSILFVGLRTMVEAAPVTGYISSDGVKPMSTIVMLVFLFTTIVAMLNILIAQLSDTYQKIQADAVKSLIGHRAFLIAKAERTDFRRFSEKRRREYYLSEIRSDLTTLSPPLPQSSMEKMDEAHTEIIKQLIDNNLELQTIKFRQHQYVQYLEDCLRNRDTQG